MLRWTKSSKSLGKRTLDTKPTKKNKYNFLLEEPMNKKRPPAVYSNVQRREESLDEYLSRSIKKHG